MKRVGDLEINQDLAFERRQWPVQRVGWGVGALIIVAALLGVFGSGPLSAATAGDEETLLVHFQRFVRHKGQGELVVKVGPNQASAGQVELWLTTEYLGRDRPTRHQPGTGRGPLGWRSPGLRLPGRRSGPAA